MSAKEVDVELTTTYRGTPVSLVPSIELTEEVFKLDANFVIGRRLLLMVTEA